MLPPPNLRGLASGGGLDSAHRGQAEATWQAAVAELRGTYGYVAEERLFWTTFLLANHHAERGVREDAVPLLEHAAPLLRQPRFAQTIMGMLARTYATLGRMDLAQPLLARLDPASEDLLVDTNYRFSAAYVAALRSDAPTVLRLLGHVRGEVPIQDAWERISGLYRAHAHEQQGRIDTAVAQLQQLAPTPSQMDALASMARLNPRVPLAVQSLPRARNEIRRLHDNVITTRSGMNLGRLMLVTLLVVPVVFAAAFVADAVLPPERLPYVLVPTIFGSVVFSIAAPLIFLLRSRAREKRIHTRGVAASARVLVVQQTGTQVNDQPLLELRMLVETPGRPAYAVAHREVVPHIRLAQLQPGTVLAVKVDPGDRRRMAIVW